MLIIKKIFFSIFVLTIWFMPAALQAQDIQKNNWQGVERVVALGDIHGDFDQFTRVLRDAGLINQRNVWIGGKTHFVQTGDVPDRGPETRKIMNLLMVLERQAKNAGGMVHALIGNHESMNAYGDLRYVTKKEYTAFKGKRSKKNRKTYYKQYIQYVKDNTAEEEWPEFDKEYKKKWEKEFPLGWVEHRNAWGPNGLYGQWVAHHNGVIIINDSMFMHGGLSPKFATTALDSMNVDIRADVFFGKGITRDPDGPLWYRGISMDDEALLATHVDDVLAHHKLNRIVVGHTTTKGAVRPRYGKKVLMIDIGLGKHYGSNFAYLDITDGKATAIHRGVRLDIPLSGTQAYIDYLEKAAALDGEALNPEPSPLLKRIAKQKKALEERG
jgi:hypothetical protein